MKTFIVLFLFAGLAFGQRPIIPAVPAAAAVITDLAQIGTGMPAIQVVQDGKKLRGDGLEAANAVLAANAISKAAKLRIVVDEVVRNQGEKWTYRVKAEHGRVTLNGLTIPYSMWVYFAPENAAPVADLKPGAVIIVSGSFTRADIKVEGTPRLNLDLRDAKIEPR